MGLNRTTPPAAELLSLDYCRRHIREFSNDSDDDFGVFKTVAEEYLDGRDGILNRALVTQAWEWSIDNRFPKVLHVPLPPCRSIGGISYTDTDGATQTLAAADYRVFGIGADKGARILPAYGKSWPTTRCEPEAVRVTFTAGYGDTAADVPEAILQAAVMFVAAMDRHRGDGTGGESRVAFPFGAKALIARYIFRKIS